MFENDGYFQNDANTILKTVDLFMEAVNQFGSITLQKYYGRIPSSEMFSVRRIRESLPCVSTDLYIIGNTFVFDEIKYDWNPIPLAKEDNCLVDFNRVEVVTYNELRIYVTNLISDWVEEALGIGNYAEEGKSKENEIAEILHNMVFWDNRNPKWTTYDPNDKVNKVWLSQYKTEEDRENLFKR